MEKLALEKQKKLQKLAAPDVIVAVEPVTVTYNGHHQDDESRRYLLFDCAIGRARAKTYKMGAFTKEISEYKPK